jgi:hypothetical protein
MHAGSRWILLLCAVPSVLLGQTPDPVLKAGDRVWVSTQSGSGTYVVHTVSPEALTVRVPSSDSLVIFPMATLRKIEGSRRPDDPFGRFVQRSSIGLLVGAVVGGLLGEVAGDNASNTVTTGGLVAVGGAVGFVIGCVSGLNSEWKRVPLPPRVSVATPRDGVFAVSYSF